jgi:hypothetical protein
MFSSPSKKHSMDQSKAIEYAKRYFQAWPKVDVFFITSDGQAFFNTQDAAAHANGTRKDKIVVEVQRGQIAEPAAAAATVTPGSETPATGSTSGAPAK